MNKPVATIKPHIKNSVLPESYIPYKKYTPKRAEKKKILPYHNESRLHYD
jgi:hypothetical protein